jgi:hypothetical protein
LPQSPGQPQVDDVQGVRSIPQNPLNWLRNEQWTVASNRSRDLKYWSFTGEIEISGWLMKKSHLRRLVLSGRHSVSVAQRRNSRHGRSVEQASPRHIPLEYLKDVSLLQTKSNHL